MIIKRIEFIGYRVTGPNRNRSFDSYKADSEDWKGWTARAEGQAVLLEHGSRRIEVPRQLCQIEWGEEVLVKDCATYAMPYEAQGVAAMATQPKRKPGRPPKAPPPDDLMGPKAG